MRKNYHREALAILEHQDTLEMGAMLWWIAKAHPAVFVWAARANPKTSSALENVDYKIIEYIKAGLFIDAIKRYREIKPGVSLGESKTYCDNIKLLINTK